MIRAEIRGKGNYYFSPLFLLLGGVALGYHPVTIDGAYMSLTLLSVCSVSELCLCCC